MSNIIEKRCLICGKDVSKQKRTKDSAGHYYCNPCYESAQQRIGVAEVARPSPPAPTRSATVLQSKSPLVRRAEWTLVIGLGAFVILFTALTIFWGEIGGRDGKVVIPTLLCGLLSFLTIAYAAMWLAKNGQEVKQQGGFATVLAASNRLVFLKKIVRVLVIASMLPIWIFIQTRPVSPSHDRKRDSWSSDPAPTVAAPKLPSIHIKDESNQLTFSNWHVEGYNLVGVMVAKGPYKIDTLTYTLRRNGTVVRRGDVHVPGNVFKKGESNEVTILCWEEPTALDVTIEVGY